MLSLKNKKGFTIIEVLIVLAIAGVIMLIVFLAVPALQRNSRNTGYRNEASRILAAVTEWTTNHDGNLPAASDSTEILASAAAKNYTSLTITNPSTGVARTPTLSAAYLEVKAKCPAATTSTSITPVTAGAATRQFVLIYAVEDSSNNATAICTAS